MAKSRRRDPNAHDFGTYWLLSIRDNAHVFPGGGAYRGAPGADLDEIEQWLSGAHATEVSAG